jgi:predicted permease
MLTDLFHRIRSLFARSVVERELDEELRFHFDRQVESYERAGLDRAEARRRARLEFGGFDQVKEEYRDALGTRLVDECWQDLRHAVRSISSNLTVSIVVVLSLALGVGANTAIFSLVNALLLRSLPVHDPDRLVLLGDATPARAFSNPVWEQIRRRPGLVEGAFAWSPQPFNLTRQGEAQFVDGLFASSEFFDVLGVQAALGRTFTTADDRRGGGADGPVAVISDGFWRRRFGGSPDAIGKPLMLGAVTFTVVGVTPPSFFGPDVGRRFDVAIPIGAEPLLLGANSALDMSARNWLRIMLRLKPEQSLDAASAALRGIHEEIRAATMPGIPVQMQGRYLDTPFGVTPASTGQSTLRAQYARPLVALMTIVALVLLIACLNIANVMLARADARRHEMSIRTSLGASRARLARLVLTEVAVLTGIGGLTGLALSRWMSALLVQQLSTRNNVVFLELTHDWRVLGFASAVAVLTAVLLGVVPAWQSARANAGDSLKERGRGSAGGGRSRVATGLVVGQVALSLVLLVAAGLFVRTFASLSFRDVGFTKDRVLVVNVTAPMTQYTLPRLVPVYERIREAVAALPGVERAALSDITPVAGSARENLIDIPGSGLPERERLVAVNVVSPGWFDTYGTRLLAGRDFGSTDRLNAPQVALVNEAFVRKYLGKDSPVGRTVAAGIPGKQTNFEIVGVVEDAVYRSLRDPVPPTLYTPTTQRAAARPSVSVSVSMPRGSTAVTTRVIANAIQEVDPNLVLQFTPLTEQVNAALNRERILALLSGFLGALALLLAGLGLYGLTAYAVGRRRAEIGLRIALGATAWSVIWLVVRRAGLMVATGIAGGAMLSLWASQFVLALVWGLEARDTATLVGAAVTLTVVGAVASWIPARQAARIDPIAVLRES